MARTLSTIGKTFIALSVCALLAGCSSVELASHYTKRLVTGHSGSGSQGDYKVGSPYKIGGKWYRPQEDYNLVQTGTASWYGPGFHGKRTANGEIFDQYAMTAAHKTLQMPAIIRVTNLENGRSAVLRVNDRGPFARGRILDVSKGAAQKLGFVNKGTARVRVEVLKAESMRVAAAAKSGQPVKIVQYASAQPQRAPRRPVVQPHIRNTQAEGYQVASMGRYSPVVNTQQPVARLVNDARMDLEYEPMGSGGSGDLPESLQRPVLTKRQIEAQQHHETRGQNLNTPPSWDGNTAAQAPVALGSSSAAGDIYVQAGAFGDAVTAENVGKKLSHIAPVRISTVDVNARRFYRVRLGPLQSVDTARQVEQKVRQTMNTDTRVVIEK
ncbi:MAG: septal ring lytic transglycosylase RlpA family protein [Alphaproteobacteria bacterium]|nr:MAG: septal ring lytic transglycosylase RlpA family protein [Alphaproteobacteria bacterium]